MDNKVLGAVPVDADGNIVPFTTRFMFDEYNVRRKVVSFGYSLDDGKWHVRLEGDIHYISKVRLHRYDNWAMLDEDLKDAGDEHFEPAVAYFASQCEMNCDYCEFADPDDDSATNACSTRMMMLDIRERVKRLRENDVNDQL